MIMVEITRDLVRSLHAAIARRSWHDVESAANALDNVEGFHRRQVKDLEAIIASMKQDRSYIIGFNDGWEEAMATLEGNDP
jgi:hypothetical protein